mgnify:CR=1 FL=1
MGTSNFYKENASSYFAVCMDEDWEFELDCLNSCFEERGYELIGDGHYDYDKQVLAFKDYNVGLKENDDDFTVKVKVLLRAGYYEGANLDWEIEVESNWLDYEDFRDYFDYANSERLEVVLEEFAEVNRRDVWMSEPYTMDQQHQIYNNINSTIERAIEEVEKDFKDLSSHELKASARFSNGETWYSEV